MDYAEFMNPDGTMHVGNLKYFDDDEARAHSEVYLSTYDKDGRVIKLGECDFPKVPATHLARTNGVVMYSLYYLLAAIPDCLDRQYGDAAKMAYHENIGAVVWSTRGAQAKPKTVAILVHRPRGIIKPFEWPKVRPELEIQSQRLHFLGGNLKKITKEMRLVSEKFDSRCISVFDQDNLVLLTYAGPGAGLFDLPMMWLSPQGSLRNDYLAFLRKGCCLAGVPENLTRKPPPGSHLNERLGLGRNDLCPCGSGKRFEICHGKE